MFIDHLSLEKGPKCSTSYMQKLISYWKGAGTFLNTNTATAESLILPAMELNENMLKAVYW